MSKGKWLFHDKPAIVHAPDFGASYDRFGLSLKYDDSKEGLFTLRYPVRLEGFDDMQTLTLVIRPEMIADISCDARSDEGVAHHGILDLIPDTSVRSMADVLHIRVNLRSPGRVICPAILLPIQPRQPLGRQFMVFAQLCQATTIRIYLGRNQVLPDQRSRLGRFVLDVVQGKLRAPPIDLRRTKGGQAGQETDWSSIHPPTIVAPPEYDNLVPNPRKRPRTASSSSTKETFVNQFCQGLGSPTEVNTPSTRENSPEEREKTQNTSTEGHVRASTTEQITNCAGTKTTGRRGSTPLPEYQPTPSVYHTLTPSPMTSSSRASREKGLFSDIKATNFFPAPSTTNLQSEMALCLGNMLQAMLPKVVESAFQSILGPLIDARLEDLVTRKLEALVHQNLPTLTNDALEQNMENFLSNVEDGNTRAEIELAETVDVAKTELHETRDNGIKELESFVQQKIADFDADSEEITRCAVETLEDKTTELKERIDAHWRRRFKKRRAYSGIRERRRSV